MPKSQKAAEQAVPAIAVAGVPPVTGDAPSKGEGETSRSEWRLGVAFSPRVIISFMAIGAVAQGATVSTGVPGWPGSLFVKRS